MIFKSTYTYALKRKTKFQFTPINFGVILILMFKIWIRTISITYCLDLSSFVYTLKIMSCLLTITSTKNDNF